MAATPSGADGLANTLLTTLLDGETFEIPSVDLSDEIFQQPEETGDLHASVSRLVIEDLTAGVVGGDGAFDKVMSSIVAHLKVEYENNRISGAEFTKAYISLVTAALQTSSQFLLGRDQAYWQAVLVQKQAQLAEIEATKARVELETARVELAKAKYEAVTAEAAYGLTKIEIAVKDMTYAMIQEQREAQRAQTMDTRSDGVTGVAGAIGKQKELYTQQITSYKRDAETKYAKLLSDTWITQKTLDDGLLPPYQFTNSQLDVVMARLRDNLTLTV